ncbi:MAG: 3-oxoacyl-ACP reductase, partial [Sinobacteraceae bacterium]|nr:3-oxoacyl-ACP reductase [Nevskiaceae bacterium]
VVKRLGLPTPQHLARADGAYVEQPLSGKIALLGEAAGGYAGTALAAELKACGAKVYDSVTALTDDQKADALVFDATGIKTADDLGSLYEFFHPLMRRVGNNGRALVLTGVPEEAESVVQAAAWRGVEGFVRSLGKELGKRAATANVLYVGRNANERIAGPARFFLSRHSAYVDGQPLRVDASVKGTAKPPRVNVLKGKTALVTGAARGIGAATAARLAAEGAQVVGLDIPNDLETLEQTLAPFGGLALAVDITDAHAPEAIAAFLKDKAGGVDVVVHNAGVTRDKTLKNMSEKQWNMVLQINLAAILRIEEHLHANGIYNDGARTVCMSSIGGIAGNMGQTNYATTKAALIGFVAAAAPEHAARGIGINAVAPGFIETRMTAAMPFTIREAGRRMNSLSQGGQPQDVAEAVCFLASPGAVGVSGQVLRVCGQSLIGA